LIASTIKIAPTIVTTQSRMTLTGFGRKARSGFRGFLICLSALGPIQNEAPVIGR
jgi:hypothetical protein